MSYKICGERWRTLAGTDGGGINIYNYKNKTVRAIMHLPGDRHSLPVNSFACLYTMMRIMFGRAVSGED